MPVSESYRTFILETLGRVLPDIRSRKMFGGVGVYCGDLFFALLDNDTLYFKVDDETRGDYEAIRMGPFRPFGEGGESMQYYEVSAELIEEPETLAQWAERAVAVARRAAARRIQKTRGPR
ncbi:MAG TPA: TfoX/Sxy family protein [Gemmatimonas sp.]|nr:TfoX/Sxy family protein [Gemmatimonas sp.]